MRPGQSITQSRPVRVPRPSAAARRTFLTRYPHNRLSRTGSVEWQDGATYPE
ncbi:hypothetical protein GCM10017687_05490 [Streptomyces echinatus]